jgi:hypothetical protein
VKAVEAKLSIGVKASEADFPIGVKVAEAKLSFAVKAKAKSVRVRGALALHYLVGTRV